MPKAQLRKVVHCIGSRRKWRPEWRWISRQSGHQNGYSRHYKTSAAGDFLSAKRFEIQAQHIFQKLSAPQYHKDGKYAGNVIPDLMIEDGTLNILTERDGRKIDHCFEFLNENFVLIYYFDVIWDGKNTSTETKFDLVKGNYSVESRQLGFDEVTVLEKKKIVVKPLPKIQDFVPFENNKLY